MQDQFGNPVTCTSHEALDAYDRAVDAHLHAWPGVLAALDEALIAAPDFALAHALQALVLAIWARGAEARAALARAQVAPHDSAREGSQIELIALMLQGRTVDAQKHVIQHVRAWPTDALTASTALGAYGLFAFSGRLDHDAARLTFTEALAAHFPENFPWLMAYRGWARIESGNKEEGMYMAQRAIGLRPTNAHNAHIVMHGFYELGQAQAALDFATQWLPSYPQGLLWGHLHWHAALAEADLGHTEQALQRLLGPIAEFLPHNAPYMGLPDIISLPWRLGLRSVTSLPWTLAQQHVQKHFANGSNVFGELHLAMLATAREDRAALDAIRQRTDAMANAGHGGAAVVSHWAKGLRALLDGDEALAQTELTAACEGAPRVGGSHAQRMVIEETRNTLRIPLATLSGSPQLGGG